MSVPRVLLLTHTPPGYPRVGGLFLRDLCLSYPRDSICCFAVISPNGRSTAAELDWLPVAYAPFPHLQEHREPYSCFARLIRFVQRRYVYMHQTPALASEIVQFARQHNVTMIWAVLDDPFMISLTKRVASALNAEVVTTVWDPPEYQLMQQGYDRFSRRTLLREFADVMRISSKCGVASEGMASEYSKRYSVEPVVMIHGVHPDLRRSPARGIANNGQFVIGVAGSLYALREWQCLLSALDRVHWQIDGRAVIVRVVGSYVFFQARSAGHMEYLGWRSEEDAVSLMSEVDVAYLPYWFDEVYSLAVRLCFPNKLATYLAAGRPVFYHGPEDSSPARFFERFPIGVCCHSLDEIEIIDKLKRFISGGDFYASVTQAGQDALDQELSSRVFRQRFAALIGIEENQLSSLCDVS